MNIYFGVVKKYFPQKGFGFVTHPLDSETRKDVFFHISNVQKSDKGIADKLSSYEPNDDIYFWYGAEITPKGEQIKSVLRTDAISELLNSFPYSFTKNRVMVKIKYIWRSELHPIWLCDVTLNVIGIDGLNKLKLERENLMKERERLREIDRERIMKEKQKQQEQQEQQERQRKIEEEEFELLVAEMEPKGFTMSEQVSNYIIRNRLGDKYKNISGVLEMKNSGSSWKFNGGFPPKIYAMLCERLKLGNKGTQSRVVRFTPFKDL